MIMKKPRKRICFFTTLKKLAKRKEKFYSSLNWNKIYRVIASIRRKFVKCSGFMTMLELTEAQAAIINNIQQSVCSREYKLLRDEMPLSN